MISRKLFTLLPAVAILSGCLAKTDRTRFYYLSTPLSAPPPAVQSKRVFLVGLRVTAAEYLRTKQMLVETGTNQLRLSDENLWQETPQSGFARVLSRRFAEKLPECQLTSVPVASTNRPEMIVEVELLSLQGRLHPANEAEASVEVRLLDAHSRLLERHELRQTTPWSSVDAKISYPALAAAESQAVANLADAIADKVSACRQARQ
jgi:uncharacterized lipoprotein YmbA